MSRSNLDVAVGKLREDLEQHVLEELGFDLDSIEGGATVPPDWARFAGSEVRLFLPYYESLALFRDHVARLEGFKDSGRAFGRTRFISLPWWETSVWLPVRLKVLPTPRPVSATFIGSALALMEELSEIQRMSDLDLGRPPEGYDTIAADPSGFESAHFDLLDEREALRWIWRGLRDAAEAATKLNAPAWLYASAEG